MLTLYTYFRSSAAYRVRIALGLKGLAYDSHAVHLVRDGGQQHADAYRAINPQALVPSLETADGAATLTQSLAIMEYLEETHPEPPLLPKDAKARAQVRALAAIVGCDIHPINNRRILQYLQHQLGADKAAVERWCGEWITKGFDAYEKLLSTDTTRGDFSWGDRPTVADCYLIPQIASARRFHVDMARWPLISAVDAACGTLPAFQRAAPVNQPDAVPPKA